MQTKMEQAVRITAQLYEARDVARRLLGDRYQSHVGEACAVIKAAARDHGGSEIRAATALAREDGGFTAVLLLAAVVELAEPTAPPSAVDTRKPCTCDGAGRGPGRVCGVQAGQRLGDLWRCVRGLTPNAEVSGGRSPSA